MLLLNFSLKIFYKKRSCISIFSLLLFFCPIALVAQDEVALPVYIRPAHKVFKSLNAALQQPDSVFILELKGKRLKEIPEGVFKLPYLVVLDMGRNKIKEIPQALLKIKSLEELDLSSNKISELPENIGSMNTLKKLSLNRNLIEVLPSSIGNMDSLEVLELWDNEIGTLPEEIKKLSRLKTLELRGILFSEEQHKHFHELLPNTAIYLSPSCNCK